MHNILFYLFFSFIFLLNISIFAQERTYSPYSRFGIGEIYQPGYSQNSGMGNTGIALQSSNHLNNSNPASYSSIDTLSFFLEAGITGFNQNLSDKSASANYSDVNFDYFAFGFPLSKYGYTSLGLVPYSNMGYNINQTSISENIGEAVNTAMANGNISKVYWGISIKPQKNLSIGAHASYLFGNLQTFNAFNDVSDGLSTIYGRQNKIHVSDLTFDFGAQYRYKLTDTHSFLIGATFMPQTGIKGSYSTIIAENISLKGLESGDLNIKGDTITPPIEDNSSNALTLPLSYGIGLTYEIQDMLLWTAEYKFDEWSLTNNNFFSAEDSWRFASGIEFIPKERDQKNYINRIRYRLGVQYSKEYYSNNTTDFYNFGMSFGLGLPLKRSKSSINLSIQYGKKGTLDNNNVQEKYTRLTLGFTMHEYWFVKRKFE
ncbi:MAG: hypothetical protein JW717_00450 [Marinilabiliaceae bacterium]|nr:hypothetical protein [Marinilabiliaceae bacterium]